MTRSKMMLLTAGAATVAIIGSLSAWYSRSDGTDVTAADSYDISVDTEVAGGGDRGVARASERRRSTKAGESTDVGLPKDLEALEAMARAGNVAAACEFGRRAVDCVVLRDVPVDVHLAGLERMEATAAGEAANDWAHVQIAIIDAAEQCADIPDEILAKAPDYLRQAAQRGNVAAMVKYASGDFFGPMAGLEVLQDDGFSAWRAEAEQFMQQAARSGSVEAVFALTSAYASDGMPFDALIPNDQQQYLEYALLFDLATGAQPHPRTASPEAYASALDHAQSLHKVYFDERVVETPTSVIGPTWINGEEGLAHSPCSS